MSLNIEAIDKTIARIRQNQNFKFNMRSWGGNSDQMQDDNGHPCGTSACIAGFAALASNKIPVVKDDYYIYDKDGNFVEAIKVDVLSFYGLAVVDVARDELGLTFDQATALFLPHQDSTDVYSGPEFFTATEDQGIAVLEHLKATGEVNWMKSGIPAEDSEFFDAWKKNYGISYEEFITVRA